MSDVERETYLHAVRAKAWTAILDATGDPGQVFAAAAEVYERELRDAIEGRAEAERGHAVIFNGAFDARTLAYEVLDELDPERPMAERIRSAISELDKVLGPDFVREADPTGKVLKSLPFAERKRMLDAFDSVQKMIDERGTGQSLERDAAAERMSDYLTQLGVDPDETFEGDSRTTAQILADVALAADGPVEVSSPEHQASERLTVALMAKSDVERGEGE